ncbi:beta-galactosidase [Phytomonospora sp. NPDC050363]|uniref:beta-galactosidase n=1 Tax=Phytomonospora sp. NPDC050363 TaxID=3155642 RepID=UPI0033DDD25A
MPQLSARHPVRALALMTVAAVLATGAPAHAEESSAAAAFQVGVTFEKANADSWNDPGSVADAKEILASLGPLQNQHIMGFGAEDPEPSPGVYDWGSLDERMDLIAETGGTAVITLCSAPGWMKPGWAEAAAIEGEEEREEALDAIRWNMDLAPLPQYYDEFAALSAKVAQRYPQVRYFQVWNEFKGFWDDARNRWDHEGYTAMYNQVYAAVKAVRSDAQIGGPYVSLNTYWGGQSHPSTELKDATWGTADQRDLDAMTYWLANKTGAQFFTIDTWSRTRDGHHQNATATKEMFADITAWVRSKTTLPIWWSEFYAPAAAGSEASTPALMRAAVEGVRDGGASVALWWGPECDSVLPCLWTSTQNPGGGQVTGYTALAREFSGR